MTREAFIERLRQGLSGLHPQAIAEALADYRAHFAEGEAAGRSEEEVAAALGDPSRLARELRAEIGLKRWEEERNASAAAGAVFAVLGLGALDVLILLPVLIGLGGALLGFFITAFALMVCGGVVATAGPFLDFPGGIATALLAGLGLVSGGLSLGAVTTLIVIALINVLVWYGRLHYRLLKPAIEPQPQLQER